MDMVSYTLSKKYTDNTADTLGSLKGAPATVSGIEKVDGGTKITLQWTGTSGATETQSFIVEDGVSPTASVVKENGETTITITDEEGTTTATVLDGTADEIVYTGTTEPNPDDGYRIWVNNVTNIIKYWNAESKTWDSIASGSGGDFAIIKVDTLPTSEINSKAIYIVPSEDVATSNIYEEYVYINGAWELLGSYESEKEAAEEVLENSAISESDIDNLFK